MDCFRFAFRIGVLVLFFFCFGCSTDETAQEDASAVNESAQPNIVIILCDDLGYGDLSCYGNDIIKTPNLDEMAAQGIRFTDCYSAAPVCSPSRAGLITGRIPSRTGIYTWIHHDSDVHLKDDEITIADQLSRAGYSTGLFGKWHCNSKFNKAGQPQPDDHGFQHWIATHNNASPSHANPNNFVQNGKPLGEMKGYSCQIVTQKALDWIAKQDSAETPFFAFITFHEPHEPVASPPHLTARYMDKAQASEQAEYYANVSNVDSAVGQILSTLEKTGLAENTLVIFTSHNGPETLNRYKHASHSYGSTGSLKGMKLWNNEGGIRVPGIAYWKGSIPPNQVLTEPITSLDFFPTACAVAGTSLPATSKMDGANILSLMYGGDFTREKPLFWHFYTAHENAVAAMRIGNYKIIGFNDEFDFKSGQKFELEHMSKIKGMELQRFELYDLAKDPNETKDLSRKKAKKLEELKATFLAYYSEVLDEGIDWSKETSNPTSTLSPNFQSHQ